MTVGHLARDGEGQPLRLTLAPDAGAGSVDGAWWPHSRDLGAEVVELVDHFPEKVGRVERLLFSRPDWDAAEGGHGPRRLSAAHGAVEVTSFASDDTHLAVLTLTSGQRLRLLVVPNDTGPARAARIMDRCAGAPATESPASLLGLSGPDQSEIGDEIWDRQHDLPS